MYGKTALSVPTVSSLPHVSLISRLHPPVLSVVKARYWLESTVEIGIFQRLMLILPLNGGIEGSS